jgi:hypothetical protein
MDHTGIDAHKRERQIYILVEGGEALAGPTRQRRTRAPVTSGSATRSRCPSCERTSRCWATGSP